MSDRYVKPPRLWTADDLWTGIPAEFKGAELSPALMDVLRTKPLPASLALVGPPGTGKTRSLWALLHRMRAQAMKELIGTELFRDTVSVGEYSHRSERVTEAIERQCDAADLVGIITEVGDVRAHRYDRPILETWIKYEYFLAVDDIGAIEPNEWVREALYHLANERRSAGRFTIWTSNLSPTKIRDTFGAAIASRILGGAVVEVDGADRRLTQ